MIRKFPTENTKRSKRTMARKNAFDKIIPAPSVLRGELRPECFHLKTLVEIFEQSLQKFSSRTALRCGDTSLTYEELGRETAAKAAWLRERGVRPGKLVGLWMERGIAYHQWSVAILRAGAGFVPFDADVPESRASVIAEEAELCLVLVDAYSKPRSRCLPRPVLRPPAELPPGSAPSDEVPSPDDTAYVIFTSGSTGKPKGVQVLHRQAAHWALSENCILGIRTDDVVYQGFSPSFDMAIEETWLTYLAGGTLEISELPAGKVSDQLPDFLRSRKVTVLHAVPTLVSLFPEPIPGLRILNLGGEACPTALAERWAGIGPRLFNTYGPTETTVTATAKELFPGSKVTIGSLLPNYLGFVVNEAGEIVPRGQQGELWIGGPSVAAGYLHRPDLTASRFLPCPFPEWREQCPVLYRTGDLVAVDEAGEINFFGRIDQQVKVRGHRVELGEIEEVIAKEDGVQLAVVAPRPGLQDTRLVCFLQLDPRFSLADPQERTRSLQVALKEKLPSYMLPAEYVIVDGFTRLASGKVDRKLLPFPALASISKQAVALERTASPVERRLIDALQKLFPSHGFQLRTHFFDELGGDSLLAARWVTELRATNPPLPISIRQIYEGQTVEKIAALVEDSDPQKQQCETTSVTAANQALRLCALAQAAALSLIYGLLGLLLSGPYLVYTQFRTQGWSILVSTEATAASIIALPPLVLAVVVSLKWLVLGRAREGDYPLWGSYYLRFWFVRNLLNLVPSQFFAGTPLYGFYLRSLGCQVGADATIGKVHLSAPDLAKIGTRASLGTDVHLETMWVENGLMKLRSVTVGDCAMIGSSAVLGGGSDVGPDSEVGNLSYVQRGCRIPAGERWEGAPACHKGNARLHPEFPDIGAPTRIALGFGFTIASALLPLVALLPFLPALVFFRELEGKSSLWKSKAILLSPVFAFSYVLIFAFLLVAAKWLVLGKAKPGKFSVFSLTYFRKWFVDQFFELSLETLHSLFATLYLPPLYRLLGAKIGKRTEISTATSITFDLLEVADESFIADNAIVGDPEICQGWMDLRETRIGRRTFIGNSAVVPDGMNMPNESLLGVLSLAPNAADSRLVPGSSWLGVPAIPLPGRHGDPLFDENHTFRPSPGLWLARLSVEGARILLPPTLLFVVMVFLTSAFSELWSRDGLISALASFPFLYLGLVSLPVLLVNLTLKWLVVGKYQAGKFSMWSFFVWRTEAVTAIYESTLVPLLLEPLCGTPFLAFFLRLFGTKIGRNCFLDTTDFTEFDMVSLGDGVTLNQDSGAQTHLFEDRVMKIGPVSLGNRATIASRAIVLLEANIGAGVCLRPLSLVMRGESLPPNTTWVGAPAAPEIKPTQILAENSRPRWTAAERIARAPNGLDLPSASSFASN
jgi:non-ribosomal peptide synthetase-like protein